MPKKACLSEGGGYPSRNCCKCLVTNMQPTFSVGIVMSSVGRSSVSDFSGWIEVPSVIESIAV